MTLSELITYVRGQILEPTEGFWTDAEITGYIQEAMRLVRNDARKKSVITATTSASSTIAVPSTVLKIHRADLPDNIRLEPRSINVKDKDSLESAYYYVLFGDTMYVYPEQDTGTTITLYVTVVPTIPTVLGTEIDLDASYHIMLGDYAVYKCKRKDDDAGAQSYYNDFIRIRQQMIEENQNKILGNTQVEDDWEDYWG